MAKNIIVVIILSILMAEILIFDGFMFYGLEIHLINLFLILFLIFLSSKMSKMISILHSLALLILMRIVYLSMPQFFSESLQYLLIFVIMFIPIYLTIKCQQCQQKELGHKRYAHLSISIVSGFLLNVFNDILVKPDKSAIYLGGEMMTVFLIICLSISLLLPDKYLDQKHISYSIDICSIPTMLTFISILIFRIISVI